MDYLGENFPKYVINLNSYAEDFRQEYLNKNKERNVEEQIKNLEAELEKVNKDIITLSPPQPVETEPPEKKQTIQTEGTKQENQDKKDETKDEANKDETNKDETKDESNKDETKDDTKDEEKDEAEEEQTEDPEEAEKREQEKKEAEKKEKKRQADLLICRKKKQLLQFRMYVYHNMCKLTYIVCC
jgi:hypothetical protein